VTIGHGQAAMRFAVPGSLVSGVTVQACQEKKCSNTAPGDLEQALRVWLSASMFHRATDIHRGTSLTKLFSHPTK
jgi:hypothetical protein